MHSIPASLSLSLSLSPLSLSLSLSLSLCKSLLKYRDESFIAPNALLQPNVSEAKAKQNVPDTSSPTILSSFIHVK